MFRLWLRVRIDLERDLCNVHPSTSMRTCCALVAPFVFSTLVFFTGCTSCSNQPSNPEQVRQSTANATAEIKNDVKAAAEGVRDGLRRPTPDQPLDLNTASKSQLTTLPGISDETADRIMANRPYRNTHELIDRKLVSPTEYGQIASQITVR